MTAPAIVQELVKRFEDNRESYRSGKYNETQLRREFLDPFFEALGWDVFNKGGISETFKDVIHEDSLEIEGENKAPDLARSVSFAWDSTGDVFFVVGAAGGYGLITKPEWDYRYVLGLLNSRLLDYIIKSQSTQMESGFYSFEARFIRSAPIYPINFSDPAERAMHDKWVSLVERMLALHKQSPRTPQEQAMVKREIESTDGAIDKLVYELSRSLPSGIIIPQGDDVWVERGRA